MKRYKLFNTLILFSLLVVLIVSFNYVFPAGIRNTPWYYIIMWCLGSLLVVCSFSAYNHFWLKNDPNLVMLTKEYRIIALIPSFNEDSDLLDATIMSILNQSLPILNVYVMDDGSNQFIRQLNHPQVTYFRQPNQGKRYAQKNSLDQLDPDSFDYILTVDSDSVLEKNAVKTMVTAFQQNPNLRACTGVVLTRNRKENFLTKIADLNIGISCIIARPIRSMIGSLETTSGALALYEKSILLNRLEEYVTSGTYSDDRQLCLYSLLDGDAIGLTEAVVYSEMPTTLSDTLNQRLRWAKGSWRAFPYQLRQLSPKKLIFPLLGMLYLSTLPFLYSFLVLTTIRNDYRFLALYLVIRLIIYYFEALLFLKARQDFHYREWIGYLIVVIPATFLFTIGVLVFLKYRALFHLKKSDWLTRSN